MFVDRGSVDGRRSAAKSTLPAGRASSRAAPRGIADIAPGGHYLALRVGFAFPMEEVNALPALWVEEYTRAGYAPFDPVLRWAYGDTGVTRWSELVVADPRNVMARARAHGLQFGAVASVMDPAPGTQRSFGSFAHPDREFTDEELRALRALLQARHDALKPPKNITDAEIEALRMVKDGHRLKQIAYQLGVTEGAVKQRLKNARIKLAAKTGAEAISRAATFGLI